MLLDLNNANFTEYHQSYYYYLSSIITGVWIWGSIWRPPTSLSQSTTCLPSRTISEEWVEDTVRCCTLRDRQSSKSIPFWILNGFMLATAFSKQVVFFRRHCPRHGLLQEQVDREVVQLWRQPRLRGLWRQDSGESHDLTWCHVWITWPHMMWLTWSFLQSPSAYLLFYCRRDEGKVVCPPLSRTLSQTFREEVRNLLMVL